MAEKDPTINVAKNNLISTRGLATLLGLSPERIRQMEDEGSLDSQMVGKNKYYPLKESVRTYIAFLKNSKSSAGGSDEQRKTKADADWKEAKADIERMKRDELQGMLHSAEDVEAVMTDLALEIRSALLALPGRLSKDIAAESSPTECSKMIKTEVSQILDTLARYKYDPEVYKQRIRERQGWSNLDTEEDEEDEEDSSES